MRHYEGKTKEELLKIIEQLEEKIDFLSSHLSPPSQEHFRDKYSTRILDALPDMLTVFDHDANIIELASSPPVVNPDAAAVTMVWSYIGELVFNMLVLVGAVKMADLVVREMMGGRV